MRITWSNTDWWPTLEVEPAEGDEGVEIADELVRNYRLAIGNLGRHEQALRDALAAAGHDTEAELR